MIFGAKLAVLTRFKAISTVDSHPTSFKAKTRLIRLLWLYKDCALDYSYLLHIYPVR
jgi:hypothetical protein